MTSKEAYKKFLLKINKNDSNTNIRVSKGEFVLLYKEKKLVWLSEELREKNNSELIHESENLLVKDELIFKTKTDGNSTHFKFSEKLFLYASSYSIAKRGDCSTSMVNWLVKPKNVRTLLEDTNNNPSFDYEETICILSKGHLVVYTDDFTIEKQYISYYKEPMDIDLEGYVTLDGKPSINIDPIDLNDKQIEEILDRCALEVTMRYENPNATYAAERIKREF